MGVGRGFHPSSGSKKVEGWNFPKNSDFSEFSGF